MTDTAELEVAPNNPPDWRDWINEFPSIKSVAFFCVVAWIMTALIIATAGLWGYIFEHEPAEGILGVLDRWLDALNWLTAAAVFGVVGKRATEKADVVRAEGEVKAKTIVAAAQAAALAPSPAPAAEPARALTPAATDLADVPGEGD